MSKQLQEQEASKNKDEQNAGSSTPPPGSTSENGGDNGDGENGSAGSGNGEGGDNAADKSKEPTGFPADTPLVEMTGEQREAYWKYQSRKHEDTKKSLEKVLGDLKPEDITRLQEIEGKYNTLVESSSQEQTDHADALAQAKEQGAAEERKKFAPTLLDLEIRDLLGERYDADRLKTLLPALNIDTFFNAEGEVDGDAVKGCFDTLFPAVSSGDSSNPPARKKHGGHGAGDGTHTNSGNAGKSLYQERKQARLK